MNMKQILFLEVYLVLLVVIRNTNGYLLSNDSSQDMLFFHNLILNGGVSLDPNISCDSHEPCLNISAVCNMVSRKCACRAYFEFDNIGQCIQCPVENHYCGYNSCCGSDTLVCYYGVCKPCVLDLVTMKCITKEQLMYSTLSQISLALAMVLGILALLTLLYKACKRPSVMFGRSQRLTGNRNGISAILEDSSRTSITSTQRRVLNQLRDRPPRYEREQSTVTNTRTTSNISRDPPPTPRHALGEPPPLYSEISEMPNETTMREIEPPPAYTASFPTISTGNFGSEMSITLTEEGKGEKDEVASGSSSMENVNEDKNEISTPDQEGEERNVQQ